MAITLKDALHAFVNIRNDIDAKEKEFKEWKKGRKANLDQIEAFLTKQCKDMGTDSVKADGITAFKKLKDSVTIEDKGAFRQTLANAIFIDLDNAGIFDHGSTASIADAIANSNAFDLLTLSANKTNCKAFMADNNGLMPDGIKYFSENVIQVRNGSK